MNVRTLQALLSKMDPEAEVVIVDDDRYARELRVGVGGMMSSVTGRDKYVRGCGTGTVGLEPGDELGESLAMTLSEDAVAEIEANCNYDDDTPNSMVYPGASLTVEFEAYSEEMLVYSVDQVLRDGSCIGVRLEDYNNNIHVCDILPSGVVRFESGLTAKATPSC